MHETDRAHLANRANRIVADGDLDGEVFGELLRCLDDCEPWPAAIEGYALAHFAANQESQMRGFTDWRAALAAQPSCKTTCIGLMAGSR